MPGYLVFTCEHCGNEVKTSDPFLDRVSGRPVCYHCYVSRSIQRRTTPRCSNYIAAVKALGGKVSAEQVAKYLGKAMATTRHCLYLAVKDGNLVVDPEPRRTQAGRKRYLYSPKEKP